MEVYVVNRWLMVVGGKKWLMEVVGKEIVNGVKC